MGGRRTPDMATYSAAAVPVASLSARHASRLVVTSSALGAGVIHLAFAPAHLREYVPLGLGFLAAGLFQVLWGVAVAVRDSARLLALGGVLSVSFVVVYLITRTTGLPLGPDAFRPEPAGVADVLCSALELLVGFGALLLARRTGALRSPLGRRLAGVFAGTLVLVGSATALALAAPAHAHGGGPVTTSPCPGAPVLTGIVDGRGVDTGVTTFFSCRLRHEHDGPGGHHH